MRQAMAPWAAPVAAATAATGIIAAAVAGLVTRGSGPSAVPNLFAGLLVFGVMGLLLSIPLLEDARRRQRRSRQRQEREEAKEEVQVLPPPWSRTAASLCQELGVRPEMGLPAADAAARLRQHGPNRVEVAAMPGYLSFFIKEIYEPTQLLLLCVGGLYVMFGSLEEGATAFVVIFLLVVAEVGTEWRAKRALASLKLATPHDARVRRDGGRLLTVPVCDIVPGDIVHLAVGMEVPADMRILRSRFLAVDESKMTGESVPVPKDPFALHPEEASLLERTNIATAGSLVTRGTGVGLVYQTGQATSLGQVLARSRRVKEKKTRLQKVLKEAAWVLSLAALGASALGAALGVLQRMRWQDVLLSGLSLAFATIPEELPILIAAVLAVGSQSLSRRNVYVKYLRAAENLGFVDTVLTDKTGTLTENKLLLHSVHSGSGLVPADAVSVAESSAYGGGFYALLEAWVFMSDAGEEIGEAEENEMEVVRALVEDAELGFGRDEDVVDEIHLDVVSAAGAIEVPKTGNVAVKILNNHVPVLDAVASSGDVFDQAVLVGLGASLEEKQSDPGHVFAAKNPHIQEHLRTVQTAKADAKLVDEVPFSPTLKFASRTFKMGSNYSNITRVDDLSANATLPDVHRVMYVKGAPELLLGLCTYTFQDDGLRVVFVDSVRKQLEEQILGAASAGLRLIGYARNVVPSDGDGADAVGEGASPAATFEGATFLGFLAFQDAVRPGVAAAVAECRRAGVRVVMVTGDHLKTALAVASASGILLEGGGGKKTASGISCSDVRLKSMPAGETRQLVHETSVFARATPEDKLVILETLQGSQKCVMATGDGFNDAPILAEADVGVAMGRGTDVAREAASIVFVDDNFAMVPYALAEGRRLLDNLRKALAFYLGAKLGLIALFIVGTLWQSFPLSAIQIIVLELFMDLGASTSFVMEPADTDVMRRPPRAPGARFFDAELVGGILVAAACMALTVLGSFAYGVQRGSGGTAQTSAFLAWLLAHVLLAFNMRTTREPLRGRKGAVSNRAMLVWLAAAAGLAAAVAASGTVRRHLNLVPLPPSQWAVVAAITVLGTCWVELAKTVASLQTPAEGGLHPRPRDAADAEEQEERIALLAT